MKLLPYENFYLRTDLAPREVVAVLTDNTTPKTQNIFFGTNNSQKPYEGFVSHGNFRISRIIQYRNSFLPIITGEIIEDNTGTRVHIKMRMHLIVYVFMTLWLGMVVFAGISVMGIMLSEKRFHPGIFGALLMFVFGYGLTLGSFKYESSKSKKFFTKLLQADLL